jgi:transposase InsO family protein
VVRQFRISHVTIAKWIGRFSYEGRAGLEDRSSAPRRAITLTLTRPYRQQTNEKAERFIQTLQHEWAYVRCYRSNAARLRQLANWLDHYNQRRPHDDIGASIPNSRL